MKMMECSFFQVVAYSKEFLESSLSNALDIDWSLRECVLTQDMKF
jgi:hypothetical protein